jgi:hypothetical protein
MANDVIINVYPDHHRRKGFAGEFIEFEPGYPKCEGCGVTVKVKKNSADVTELEILVFEKDHPENPCGPFVGVTLFPGAVGTILSKSYTCLDCAGKMYKVIVIARNSSHVELETINDTVTCSGYCADGHSSKGVDKIAKEFRELRAEYQRRVNELIAMFQECVKQRPQ